MGRLEAAALAAALCCSACGSTGLGDGDDREREPIRISGFVHEWIQLQGSALAYGPPVPGATVSTSLDGQTATTDAGGAFTLETVTTKPHDGCFEYTISVTAPGRPSFSVTGDWGERVVGARIAMSAMTPMVAHCT
jgi:hypothetical protein